jgi:hypothetical protein
MMMPNIFIIKYPTALYKLDNKILIDYISNI